MDSFRQLEEKFARFPGIGPRQAKRFVYHLLNKSATSVKEFVQLIEEVKKATRQCKSCQRYFLDQNQMNRSMCGICSDVARDKTLLMIVARDTDFESIEKSGAYRGLYFILGGTVPILDKEPGKRIRLETLMKHIYDLPMLGEIILSLNTTPDGEHTATIVRNALERIITDKMSSKVPTEGQIKISVLGRGLSTGTELEYIDSETIKNALSNRR